ncbi:hypothetical protein SAMD00019534_044190 [Acytostelium subglobosum LB1]|uniref:hypothetical protein n=1 Tax=Acytostelium subglobosum LB1 TaxID=1410327 RepID=UPI000644B269|nr:hypothetical protein SAMD00019534_044190 [Acytostelium subglobosum LB1]GAM21244.1 hypothetical protein SAMD00019534_044190 [Acytostelium subglobosum LB1]|eukprot:XP_012755363.1 hypothetical protein SAMD00019534_044190 [Acytostelium subglobosum LB1]
MTTPFQNVATKYDQLKETRGMPKGSGNNDGGPGTMSTTSSTQSSQHFHPYPSSLHQIYTDSHQHQQQQQRQQTIPTTTHHHHLLHNQSPLSPLHQHPTSFSTSGGHKSDSSSHQQQQQHQQHNQQQAQHQQQQQQYFTYPGTQFTGTNPYQFAPSSNNSISQEIPGAPQQQQPHQHGLLPSSDSPTPPSYIGSHNFYLGATQQPQQQSFSNQPAFNPHHQHLHHQSLNSSRPSIDNTGLLSPLGYPTNPFQVLSTGPFLPGGGGGGLSTMPTRHQQAITSSSKSSQERSAKKPPGPTSTELPLSRVGSPTGDQFIPDGADHNRTLMNIEQHGQLQAMFQPTYTSPLHRLTPVQTDAHQTTHQHQPIQQTTMDRKSRWRPSQREKDMLDSMFARQQYPNKEDKIEIVKVLNYKVNMEQVSRWFKHKRENMVQKGEFQYKQNPSQKFMPREVTMLEEQFNLESYPSGAKVKEMAQTLRVSETKIRNWFKAKRGKLQRRGLFQYKPKVGGSNTSHHRQHLTSSSDEDEVVDEDNQSPTTSTTSTTSTTTTTTTTTTNTNTNTPLSSSTTTIPISFKPMGMLYQHQLQQQQQQNCGINGRGYLSQSTSSYDDNEDDNEGDEVDQEGTSEEDQDNNDDEQQLQQQQQYQHQHHQQNNQSSDG